MYITTTMCDGVLHYRVMVYYIIVSGLFLMFFWCPCLAINVNVQYNGGLLPDIMHLGTRGFVFAAFDPTSQKV